MFRISFDTLQVTTVPAGYLFEVKLIGLGFSVQLGFVGARMTEKEGV